MATQFVTGIVETALWHSHPLLIALAHPGKLADNYRLPLTALSAALQPRVVQALAMVREVSAEDAQE